MRPTVEESKTRGRRVLATTAIVLLAVYLPHLAPLKFGHVAGCSTCTENWVKHLPLLPGLFLGAWTAHGLGFERDGSRFVFAGVLLAAILAASIWIGSRSRRARFWTALALLAAASGSAWLVAILFAA